MSIFMNMLEEDRTRMLFLDFDGTLRALIPAPEKGKGGMRPPLKASEIKIFPGVIDKIREWQAAGWMVIGASNQRGAFRRREFLPPDEREKATEREVAQAAAEIFKATLRKMGLNFPVLFATDKDVWLLFGTMLQKKGTFKSAPKPSAAMYRVATDVWQKPDANSFHVGDLPDDRGFARKSGLKFIHANKFLTTPVGGG